MNDCISPGFSYTSVVSHYVYANPQAVALLFTESTEVLLLVTNSIQRDLESGSTIQKALALTALANIGSAEMLQDLERQLAALLSSVNAMEAKKAGLAMTRALQRAPDVAPTVAREVISMLSAQDHSVLLTGVTALEALVDTSAKPGQRFSKLLIPLCKTLKRLVLAPPSQDYTIGGVTGPFLQTKLLALIRALAQDGQLSDAATAAAQDTLVLVFNNTKLNRNAGYGVLYELLRTVLALPAELITTDLASLSGTALARFLAHRDNNVRFVALGMLLRHVPAQKGTVMKHRGVVLDCLRNPDSALRRRAAELVLAVMDEDNVEELMQEVLAYLISADLNTHKALVSRVAAAMQKYGPTHEWRVAASLSLLQVAMEPSMTNKLFYRTMALLHQLPHPTVEAYARLLVQHCRAQLASGSVSQAIVHAAVWAAGELAPALLKVSPETPVVQLGVLAPSTADLDERSLVQFLLDVASWHAASDETRGFLTVSAAKLAGKLHAGEVVQAQLTSFVDSHASSSNPELQARSIELAAILHMQETQPGLLDTLLAPIPAPVASTELATPVVDMLRGGDGDDDIFDGNAAPAPAPAAAPSSAAVTAEDHDASFDLFGFGDSSPAPAAPTPAPAPAPAAQGSMLDDLDDLLGLQASAPATAPAPAPAHAPADTPVIVTVAGVQALAVRHSSGLLEKVRIVNTAGAVAQKVAVQVAAPKSMQTQVQGHQGQRLEAGASAQFTVAVRNAGGQLVSQPVPLRVQLSVLDAAGERHQVVGEVPV